MNFDFATATQVVFGAGRLAEVGELAKPLGRHALVVTGGTVARAEKLLGRLHWAGLSTATFAVTGEPEIATVERGTAFARGEGCDVVVALGGGSVIDAGKAIAAMLTNPGEILDYVEIVGRGRALTQPSAPFIAIPTTAGTGSEVTRNAVLGAPEQRVKVSLRSPLMLPRLALVDPELTYDLPPALTASTGLDALTQLIEPFVCTRANALADALCIEGMRRAARSLRVACGKKPDPAAREDLAVAGLISGMALANAGLGAVHGLAGPIGGSFTAPHGAVCAALLPHVMTMNLRALKQRDPGSAALYRYDEVAYWLTGDQKAKAEDGVKWVRACAGDLKVPGLRNYGIAEGDFAELAAKAANASSLKANPVKLTAEELTEILRAAL
jgi:alcohol dehydrogenase class IV